ncbi:MAG: invasion associated locus B family protein [Hyphomicrobiaceae bacterium]
MKWAAGLSFLLGLMAMETGASAQGAMWFKSCGLAKATHDRPSEDFCAIMQERVDGNTGKIIFGIAFVTGDREPRRRLALVVSNALASVKGARIEHKDGEIILQGTFTQCNEAGCSFTVESWDILYSALEAGRQPTAVLWNAHRERIEIPLPSHNFPQVAAAKPFDYHKHYKRLYVAVEARLIW